MTHNGNKVCKFCRTELPRRGGKSEYSMKAQPQNLEKKGRWNRKKAAKIKRKKEDEEIVISDDDEEFEGMVEINYDHEIEQRKVREKEKIRDTEAIRRDKERCERQQRTGLKGSVEVELSGTEDGSSRCTINPTSTEATSLPKPVPPTSSVESEWLKYMPEILKRAKNCDKNGVMEAMLAAAKTAIAHDAEAADAGNAAKASELSLTIAATLLGRLNGPAVQAAFLSQLIEAIAQLPATDLKALRGDPDGIDIIAASAAGERRGAIERAVRTALGGDAKLRFAVDPDLLAGLELRGAHFALRNSWQADLMQIRKAVQDAA